MNVEVYNLFFGWRTLSSRDEWLVYRRITISHTVV
jgi:hypothetical protein